MGKVITVMNMKGGVGKTTVSAHLATLQRAGLVTTRKVGQWVFFKRDEDKIAAFLHHINSAL